MTWTLFTVNSNQAGDAAILLIAMWTWKGHLFPLRIQFGLVFEIELGVLFQIWNATMITHTKLTSVCSVNSMQKLFCLPFCFFFLFFREAAKECRRRKKEYVKCLESRVAVLEVQNKRLIEELETLKDICSPKTD